MKDFRLEIIKLLNKVKSADKFAFSKYADGEYAILTNQPITNCDGWNFDPNINKKEQRLLLESFKYKHEDYHVGISCPCCRPAKHIEWMRSNAGSRNLTYANIFVNSNYPFFVENFIPEFNNWKGRVVLFANEKGKDKNLPFKVDVYVPLNINSWKEPNLSNIIEKSKSISSEEKDQLFLFSAGPLGNILSYILHSSNKNNTYIDIGSTINPWTVGNNRGYLLGEKSITKKCTWGETKKDKSSYFFIHIYKNMGTTICHQLPEIYRRRFYGMKSAEQWEADNEDSLNLSKEERENFSKFCLIDQIKDNKKCSIDHIMIDDLLSIGILDNEDISSRNFLAVFREPFERFISMCNMERKSIDDFLAEAESRKIRQIDAIKTKNNINLTIISMKNKEKIKNWFIENKVNIDVEIIMQPWEGEKQNKLEDLTSTQKEKIKKIFEKDFTLYEELIKKEGIIKDAQRNSNIELF